MQYCCKHFLNYVDTLAGFAGSTASISGTKRVRLPIFELTEKSIYTTKQIRP